MWLTQASAEQKRTLLAASLGWMLDSMDILLYSMVLASMLGELGMTRATAGLMASLTLGASAVGGVLFGVLADRIGRARALAASILTYSVFTAACGLAQNVAQFAVFRVLLGLGMGGEWACGASLVAETWPSEHRGKALGLMQSSWAVGYGLAAGVAALVLPRFGWRAVFFVGILPGLLTFWIRRRVPEPSIWRESRTTAGSGRWYSSILRLWSPEFRKSAIVATVANAGTMFAWWGFFTWIPAFLSLPVSQGGAGLDVVQTSAWVIVMQVGMFLGYVSFGYAADAVGRKRAYVGYIFIAALLVPVYAVTRDPAWLLVVGPLVGFFGTGYFSGFGAITAELFPTAFRAGAQGLTYNVGRGISAVAPFLVGRISGEKGLGTAFLVTAFSFLFAGLVALSLPETRGKQLDWRS